MRAVVVSDIDDTLVDTTERLRQSLKEIGFAVTDCSREELLRLKESLSGVLKTRFYENFSSDKFVALDNIKYNIVRLVEQTAKECEVPVVLVTGRPVYMKSTEQLLQLLENYFIIDNVLYWNLESEVDLYKVTTLKAHNYLPIVMFDDEQKNLDAVKKVYPNMQCVLVDQDNVIYL